MVPCLPHNPGTWLKKGSRAQDEIRMRHTRSDEPQIIRHPRYVAQEREPRPSSRCSYQLQTVQDCQLFPSILLPLRQLRSSRSGSRKGCSGLSRPNHPRRGGSVKRDHAGTMK